MIGFNAPLESVTTTPVAVELAAVPLQTSHVYVTGEPANTGFGDAAFVIETFVRDGVAVVLLLLVETMSAGRASST